MAACCTKLPPLTLFLSDLCGKELLMAACCTKLPPLTLFLSDLCRQQG
jgi:hypothetical protein